MANTTVNKVILGDETLLDLTGDTATAADVAEGKTFHLASGAAAVGTASGGITPTGTISITENGAYDVTQYASADVNVPSGGDDPYPVRNDGKTHLWVMVDDMVRPDVTVRVRNGVKAGGMKIVWGDGSWTICDVATSTNYVHMYEACGVYEIIIEQNKGGTHFANYSTGYTSSYGIMGSVNDENAYNRGRLLAVEFGNPDSTTNSNSKVIGNYALNACMNVRKVTISEGFTRYNPLALIGCSNLREIYFPSTISDFRNAGTVGNYYPRLEKVELAQGITNDNNLTGVFLNCSNLRSIVVPDSFTTTFSNGCFFGCSSLDTLMIPSSSTVYEVAFANIADTSDRTSLTSMRKFDVPSLTAIPPELFNGATQLQSITIPAAVTEIGANAFANCYSLASITFLPTTPPTVDDANAWTNIPTDCVIHVPTGSLSAYTSASNYPSSSTYTYVEE